MNKFYQYKKCSTCVKASKFLKENSVNFKDIAIVENPPSLPELKKMLKSYDGELKKLFNTSGVQYRELNMKEKLPSMSEAQALELLSKNGKLIKRPVFIGEKGMRVGFKKEEWEKII